MSARREGGALAIVLHTHMPYVEGFGTWPFGEEWLWEALVGSYLPLLALLERDAPLTLSLTPVLCDQLEAPGLRERFSAFVQDVRRRTHEQDAAGLRAAGPENLARELDRSFLDYATALERLAAHGWDALAALGRHCQWTSAATHAVLPLLATDAGTRLQVNSGVASHRTRFPDGWRGGFWMPECAHAPWLDRALADAGVRSVCVELAPGSTADGSEHLQPHLRDSGIVFVPIDRATISLVWSERGYPASGRYRDYHHHTVHHHNPWANDGAAYDHAAALALASRHAADFVARTKERLRAGRSRSGAAALPGGGLCVCALDTELLGHWWYEGVHWLAEVVEECARQGLELVRLDDALERREPAALAGEDDWRPSSWGKDGDLSTWSGPAVAEMAFTARAAELEVVAAGPHVGASALRELMALQASDWPFMVSRGLAVPYARKRFQGHRRALARAVAAHRAPRAADSDRAASINGLRNLAVHAQPASALAR